MALQFIFGNSGAGKSHYLYERIIREAEKNPTTNYLVLVPEQFTMQTQKELCMRHPKGGILNIDVLSFLRLSHRIFEELGGNTKQVLDDEGKSLLLRKLAGQYEEKLRILGGNLKKPGYISEVKSVLSEFTQYGVTLKKLDAFLERLEPTGNLYYKLQDIREIYRAFEELLADKYITNEELLDVLGKVVCQSALLQNSVIALDGFTGFTPVQNRLLGELMKRCKDVLLTVTIDDRENPFVYEHPYQLFAISKQMVTRLTKIAEEENIEMVKPVYLSGNGHTRFSANPEMAFLEKTLFRGGRPSYPEAPQGISVHVARNPKEEVRFVATEIKGLVRNKGYRYRDIGVIVGNMETYGPYTEKIFAGYEIPAFLDYKKSVFVNGLVKYIRSLFAMVEQDFSGESVFAFLRTEMNDFTREELDCLENYVMAVGLKGYKKWQAAWQRTTKQVGEEELARLNGLRVRFVERLEDFMFLMRKKSKTVEDITRAVYALLVREHMQERLQAMSARFLQAGQLTLSAEYRQIYGIVLGLFDKLVALLGEERISRKEYGELLEAGFAEVRVGVIPPGMDQVVVGDMKRTRLTHVKVLFFIGANDGFLPAKATSGGLLTERDREQFAGEDLSLAPGIKEKIYIEKFDLYTRLTKPSERVYLAYSTTASDGKADRPAYLIQEIIRLFPKLSLQDEEKRALPDREFTGLAGFRWLTEQLKKPGGMEADSWKELYTWYRNAGQAEGEKLQRILDGAFGRNDVTALTPAVARELFGDLSQASVTRLEKFARCAYAHFLRYGLRLTEREVHSFESLDWGNLAHQSMERFSRYAQGAKKDWTELSEELRREWIAKSVEESVEEYGNTVLCDSQRDAYTITRIEQLVSRSVWALTRQMESSDFRPEAYELNFGGGKIDRLDTCQDEQAIYVTVTDYKTGQMQLDITSFYHGLQLQLPVYLNAAVAWLEKQYPDKQVIPAGLFYYHMQDPILEDTSGGKDWETRLLKELKLDGYLNSEEQVLAHVEPALQGTSLYFPFSRKQGGDVGNKSKVLSGADFRCFLAYAKEKEAALKARIAQGDTRVAPGKWKSKGVEQTGCDYCLYRGVCGFDPRVNPEGYRKLQSYTVEEVMEKIREEIPREKK